jgi:hypothetical protein
VRSAFCPPFPILTLLVAVVALVCMVADAQTAQDDGSLLDDRIGSRARQLEILNGNIRRWGCDMPQYATSVAGCRQLKAQAASLAASIDLLKAGGGEAIDEPVPAPTEAVVAKKPPRLKMLTYRSKTNPSGYYRTFCVKLCDGTPIPISYSTRPGNFLSDDDKCQSSCPSCASKLFYAPTDQGIEQSVALDGQRYSNLPNALRYRTELVKDCRCKPEPWSKEAKTEYQRREVAATQTSGESIVAAGVTETARIAASGDIEVADEVETRPSASRSKDWARYRYSNAEYGLTGGYGAGAGRYGTVPRSAYPATGSSSRNGYDARSASAQPQRRRGFFLFGSR